jgi:adenosylcobinamide kinase/adenosylcobinamide-phosphate guanylyltransferase
MPSVFVLGGARSGKSRYAVAAHPAYARVVFIATAQPGDGDMAARIARHRAERPGHWVTVEEAFDVAARVAEIRGADAVIIDCVTVWIANRLLRGDSDEAIYAAVEALTALLPRVAFDVTIVSNEVGEGVHPETAMGLRFRDVLGLVNQRFAAACDRAVLMVAGLPLTLKTAAPTRDEPVQAP